MKFLPGKMLKCEGSGRAEDVGVEKGKRGVWEARQTGKWGWTGGGVG